MESKAVLLEWMAADPVDTWEMGRNVSVQSITGTRNVFVDYPELAFELFEAEMPAMQTPSGIGIDGSVEPSEPLTTEPVPTETENEKPVFSCDKAYKLYMDMNGTRLYFNGQTESAYVNYRLATTATKADAVDVYLESASGGYRLYFYDGDTKTYICVYERTDGDPGYGKGSLKLATAVPTEIFTYDSVSDTLVYTADDGENAYYMGTYSTFTTFSVSNTCYITGNNAGNVDVSQFPARLEEVDNSIPETTEPAATEDTEPTTTEPEPTTPKPTFSKPQIGTAYKMVMNNNGTNLYFNGQTESENVTYRLASTTDLSAAVDVFVEANGSGYALYFMNGNTKTYIRLYERTDGDPSYGKGSLELVTSAPAEVLTVDADTGTLIYTADADNSYYMGTYSTYTTFSVSNTYYITGDNAGNVDVSQFPARLEEVDNSIPETTEPVATEATEPTTAEPEPTTPKPTFSKPQIGTAYKMVMNSNGTNLYFNGQTESENVTYRLASTTDLPAAVDVFVEANGSGYALYFMNGNTKTYIRLYERTDGDPGYGKGSLELVTSKPAEILTYDAAADTLVYTADDGENAYYMGTYGTYTTFSVSNTYYITGDKVSTVDVSQFPARLIKSGAVSETPTQPIEPTQPTEPDVPDVYATSVKAGIPYKLSMYNGRNLYFDGQTESVTYRLNSTTNKADAVDVYIEEVSGGYHLYFYNGSTKTYIRVYAYFKDGEQYPRGSLELTTEVPKEVLTFNTQWNTLVYEYDPENAFFMGTYGLYTTFTASGTYYISGDNADNVDKTQFPARLIEVDGNAEEPTEPATTEPVPSESEPIQSVPVITLQPVSQTVFAGMTAKFTVEATGEGLRYQWQYRTSSTGSWKNTSDTGSNTATLSVPATIDLNGFQYRCKVTDQYGNTCYSATVKLIVKNHTYGCLTYTVTDDEIMIIDCDSSAEGAVVVPESIDGYPVTGIDVSAFQGCNLLTEVILPASLQTIASYAFYRCDSLSSVVIPDAVTFLGSNAFQDCVSLTDVTVGDGVSAISYNTFSGCTALENVSLGYGVELIGDGAFAGDLSLKRIDLPSSLAAIGAYAFRGCTGLMNVTIPDSVTAIESHAFTGCTDLISINFGQGVTAFSDYVLANCYNLKMISIGKSLEHISSYALNSCYSLQDVFYAGSQAKWNQITVDDGNSYLNYATIHYNHTHDYSLVLPVIVEATCTEDGFIEYTCAFGEKYREVIGAIGHDYAGPNGTVPPSCEIDGYSGPSCIHCGVIRPDEIVEASGHSIVAVPTVEPSCTENGYTFGTQCEYCQEYFIQPEQIDALGHSFYDYSSDDNATCTADGTETAKCIRCNETDTRIVTGSAFGHSFTRYISDGNATCTADGTETAKCIRCNETDTRILSGSALGHSFTYYVSDGNATCTADGTETAKCIRCNETDTRILSGSALGHSFTYYVSDGNATCTADGTETAKCDRCNKIHTRTDGDSALGHSYTDIVTLPSCTTQGYTTHACICGDSYKDGYTQPTGHSFGKWYTVTPPTATTEGKQRRDCANCDYFETDTLSAKPHITSHPASKFVLSGKVVKFTVSAIGAGLKYQWQYRTSAKGSWKATTATGYKTSTLSVSATASLNGYQYRCKITDKYGNVIYSGAATLKLVTLKITTHPVNQYLPAGKTAKFTVKASGASLKYQWQYRTSSKNAWKTVTGAGSKTATLRVFATAARTGYQYRCKITDQYGNVIYSSVATLKIVNLKITTQPSSVTLAKGKIATFKVVAKGTGLKYQWQFRKNAKSAWKKATNTGNKTSTLKIPVTVARKGYQYRCVITDRYGNTIISNAATLKVK